MTAVAQARKMTERSFMVDIERDLVDQTKLVLRGFDGDLMGLDLDEMRESDGRGLPYIACQLPIVGRCS